MSKVARRYARALIDLASDPGQIEQWGAELGKLSAIVSAPEIKVLFEAPDLSHQARVQAIGIIAERLELSYPLRSFAVVVARHGRVTELPAIVQAYGVMVDQRLKRARATLTFARQPSDAEIDQVVEGLATIAHKTIIPTVKVDETLLGGVIAELEGKIYDGSLATIIAEAEHRLAE
ncbi:MAG: ATP synthase F1 subunit delta [Candidatus Binataceae bacterium]|nr:ATP synthase F1 subunit delta [Candidatus Binataceae bacterium]